MEISSFSFDGITGVTDDDGYKRSLLKRFLKKNVQSVILFSVSIKAIDRGDWPFFLIFFSLSENKHLIDLIRNQQKSFAVVRSIDCWSRSKCSLRWSLYLKNSTATQSISVNQWWIFVVAAAEGDEFDCSVPVICWRNLNERDGWWLNWFSLNVVEKLDDNVSFGEFSAVICCRKRNEREGTLSPL